MKVKLGVEARDKITGFQGVVTGHAKYLTGCDQYSLQPKCKESSAYPDGNWFDEGRLEYVSEGITSESVKGKKNGCDFSAPIK